MSRIVLEVDGRRYRADAGAARDISIALDFSGAQPNHYAAASATTKPLRAEGFIGDTRQGGSCNAESLTLVPHCNGTHTECIGHITRQRVAIRDAARDCLHPARLLSVEPVNARDSGEHASHALAVDDRFITSGLLQAAFADAPVLPALVLRTRPNPPEKRHTVYRGANPAPFFSLEAAAWLAEQGVRHLLVDLPSLDRARDDGHLGAHRAFWGLPPGSQSPGDAQHPEATITELVYVPDDVADGEWLLNLQLPPFLSDAAPSRPLLFPVEDAS